MQARSSSGEPLNMTTADNAAQRPGAAREGLLARHPLVFYFLIAYAFSKVHRLRDGFSVSGGERMGLCAGRRMGGIWYDLHCWRRCSLLRKARVTVRTSRARK